MSPTDDQIVAIMNSTGMDFLQARNHLIGRELALQHYEHTKRNARIAAEDAAIRDYNNRKYNDWAYGQALGNSTGVQP
jgi:hypothetical protein